MLYIVRTTNTCRPTNITILQCEFDIFFLGSNIAWRGWGCSETLPYSKFRHISWEQMMTEHRGLSVISTLVKEKTFLTFFSIYPNDLHIILFWTRTVMAHNLLNLYRDK